MTLNVVYEKKHKFMISELIHDCNIILFNVKDIQKNGVIARLSFADIATIQFHKHLLTHVYEF